MAPCTSWRRAPIRKVCSGVSAPLATDTTPTTKRSSSMENSMVRPMPGDSMERAPYMRLHRSQGLQDSAAVPLYFPLSRRRASQSGGDFSFRHHRQENLPSPLKRQISTENLALK